MWMVKLALVMTERVKFRNVLETKLEKLDKNLRKPIYGVTCIVYTKFILFNNLFSCVSAGRIEESNGPHLARGQ